MGNYIFENAVFDTKAFAILPVDAVRDFNFFIKIFSKVFTIFSNG